MPVTEEVKRFAESERESVERAFPGARCVKADQMHLTLAFLGEVAPRRLNAVKAVLDRAGRGEQAFSAAFAGRGAFPEEKRARILWTGVQDGSRLKGIEASLRKELRAAGVELEERDYHPHLTLARLERPADASKWIDAAPDGKIEMRIDEIVLFESRLDAAGARHAPLAALRLRG